ncbi:hypothetical protein PGT21_012049 [Puccinia graminis f. sp. tritici]|uniref:SET domain-containing protein n=2 Tax=Puccinia graminis f. sp. tritici TaxID=56615 RepID=A0A5B0P5Q9_PUCGR|nr:hypothetical protein PGT21_012049 [Puccinia graminis f. sp. tritici]
MLNRLQALMCISILLNRIHGTPWSVASDMKLPTLLEKRGLEKESLLHWGDKSKEISTCDFPSHKEKLESSDSSQIQDQVEKVNKELKAVKISAGGEEEKPGKTNAIRDKDTKDIVLGAASIEDRAVSNEAVKDKKLSQHLVYKYDKETPTTNLEEFEQGFYKSTCFLDPDPKGEPEEFCIFINPTINNGQGMVIVAKEEDLKGFIESGLKISDEPPNPNNFKIVEIPEEGVVRPVATRKLEMGDYVQTMSPVALFSWSEDIWRTPFGDSICRQAIDHLPYQTRAAIAHLPGKGKTEDEFILNLSSTHAHTNSIKLGDKEVVYGGIYLKKVPFNHSCRPNTHYYIDPVTQHLHMRAYNSIEIGEELTTSFCSLFSDRETRRKQLQESFGIDCTCSHCLMSTELGELSDKNLLQIRKLRYLFEINDPELSVSEVEELVNLSEKERIPDDIVQSNLIAAKFYNSRQEMQKVKEHAEKSKFYMQFLEPGTNDPCLADLDMLLSKPEQHSSRFLFNGMKGKDSGIFSSSENSRYNYNKEIPTPTLELFDHGFYKSTCFQNPNPSEEPNEYCILINPTFNNNQGCVIISPTNYLKGFFQEHLKMFDNPPEHDAIHIVPVPEKGGMGAVAAQRFETGDSIQQVNPVGLFPFEEPIWTTPFGRSNRQQAIDHLPLQTRAAISQLAGKGQTEDEFTSSVIDINGFQAYHNVGDQNLSFSAVYLKASRFNHSCKPNARYYADHKSHILYIKAFKSIEIGEEVTISYCSYDLDQVARRRHLKEYYGIDCTCPHCMMGAEHGKKSDTQIQRIEKLYQLSKESNLPLSEIEEFMNLSEEETLPKFIAIAHLNAAKFYNSRKEMHKVREHAEKAKVMSEMSNEFKRVSHAVNDLETLLRDPEKHSSYGI